MCSLVLQGHQKRGSAINVPLSVLSIVWFYERTLYGDFFVKRNFSRCCVPRFPEGPGSRKLRDISLESQPCIRSIQSWIGTMMQSYASRVWLQSGESILLTAI